MFSPWNVAGATWRVELLDPALNAADWGVVEGGRIRCEYPIAPGDIEGQVKRGKPLMADSPIPIGLHHSARGCPECLRGCPGSRAPMFRQPQRGCIFPPALQPHWGNLMRGDPAMSK